MSWADPVVAAVLAVLAERTTTTARIFADPPSHRNPHDVWLTRASGVTSGWLKWVSLVPAAPPERPGTWLRR
jgi:predicted dinucleotide-utilizing enzyme